MESQRNGASQKIDLTKAAYHYDLCYSKHDDTKTRNEVCDKTMLGELRVIVNPT